MYLPLTACFDFDDPRCRDYILHPFVVISTFKTWDAFFIKLMRGPEDGFIILPAPLQENKSYPRPKASDGQGVITFDPEHGFRLKVSGLSINSLVGVDVQRDLGKKEFPEFPLTSMTWAVG